MNSKIFVVQADVVKFFPLSTHRFRAAAFPFIRVKTKLYAFNNRGIISIFRQRQFST